MTTALTPRVPTTPARATRRPPTAILAAALPGALGLAVLVAAWALSTSSLMTESPVIRGMSPGATLAAIPELYSRGVLVDDTAASLYRLVTGILVAAVIGIPAGLALGLHARAEAATGPAVQFLRMISPLSWAPVAIALFGIGHQPVIFLIAMAALWPILLSTSAGVRALDPGHLEVARSLGAGPVERLRHVIVPGVRPAMVSGLRLALGTAWIVLVPAEMLGVRSGLGYQILNARDQLAYDQVAAVIIVIGVLGYALDSLSRRAAGA